MPTRLLALVPLFLAGCLTLDDFKGQEFGCNSNSGSGHDDQEGCPAGKWCEAKRLVTGGQEGGNICVESGTHHCNGSPCPSGKRCSALSGGTCVACPSSGPCDPLTD